MTPPDNIQQFDYDVDLLQALLWQYTSAINIQALLNAKAAFYAENQTAFWVDWETNVFNLKTADDFGLAVWSIILDQPTFINNGPVPAQTNVFGIGIYNQNLTNGNLGQQNGNTYKFSTAISRLLLQLRYFQLTSSGTVPETNRMLKYLFSGYGLVYLVDDLDMTQRYLFFFPIPSEMLLMLTSFDILPRPAGVLSTIEQQSIMPFGFGQYRANLTNGNLFDGEF
jgi:hypothetical protein